METAPKPSSGNKTWLWIAGGCLGVVACIVGAVLLGFGGLYWLGSQSPDNATVQLDIPAETRVGDQFQFSIIIKNTSAAPIELTDIDFSMNFLSGLLIESTQPAYVLTNGYEALGGGETFMTYTFQSPISASGSLTVVFNAKAVSAGNFLGDVGVCIDSEFKCTYSSARIYIRP